MELGNNIYRHRTKKNMSQTDLADALNVSRQSVSKWETGTAIPELDKLIKMSVLFEVSLDELVGNESSPRSETISAPIVQHITITNRPRLSVKTVLGVLLLLIGLLIIPYALSTTKESVMISCFTVSGTLRLCGIHLLTFKYPYLFCGWTFWAAYAVYTFDLTPRWEKAYLQLILTGLFLAGMLFWTLWARRRNIVNIPTWLWTLAGLILMGLIILFCINFIPFDLLFSITHTSSPG